MKTRVIAVCVVFLLLLCGVLRGVDLTAPLPVDPDLIWGTLPNGFTYYIKTNAKPENRTELRLFVRAGSVQEDEDQRGLAHFGEHMAFNGTQKFPKQELLEYLNSIGCGFTGGLNGGTSFDFVSYQLKVPTKDSKALRKGVMIISEWAHNISFEPEEIDKERGVIMEEYRGGLSAWQRCHEKFYQVLYQGSRYADRLPIGKPEIIEHCPPEALTRFYQDWYHPANLAVVAVGDFDPKVMKALITEYFSPIPAKENPRPVQIFPIPDNDKPLACVSSDPEMSMTSLQVIWKHPIEQIKTKGDFLELVKQNLFSTLLTNRFEERSNGAFSPFSDSGAFKGDRTRSFSSFNLYFYLPADSVLAVLNYGLDELKRVALHGFSASELERAKRSLIRDMENALAEADKRESGEVIWDYQNHFVNAMSPMNAIQVSELIGETLGLVTLEDVNSMHAKLITDKNLVVNVMTNEKPEKIGITEDDVLAAIAKNRASQLVEYTDKFRDEPLLKNIPAPLPILAEEIYPATGIKRWTLANGAFVFLKSTQNRNDELLMRAFSPGGESSMSEEDYLQGSWAANLVRECGVGSFDKNELNKKLADKIVSVNPYIDRCSEGYYGSCSPVDMETMFQLVYLYANQPNVTATGYASWINKQSTFIRDQALDPEACFEDSIQVISRNRHPRANSLTMDTLQGIDPAKAVAIYRERFQTAPGDFVYIFVGNFDEETLKHHCMTYLSGGKLRTNWEAIKDDGMRYQKGKGGLVLRKGIADKAMVSLITYNDGPVTAETRQETAMLDILASEKLRENIRENRSGVYYVYCNTDKNLYPVHELSAYLSLGCSTDRVDELIAASLAVLDSLKAGLFEDKYVNTVRQARLKQMEENFQSNDWWAGRILDQVSNQFPVDGIMDEVEAINAIDRNKLAAYARKYMNFDVNCLKFVLLPEAAKR